VGLLAVDQSVLLLRQGNDITRDSVSCYSFAILIRWQWLWILLS